MYGPILTNAYIHIRNWTVSSKELNLQIQSRRIFCETNKQNIIKAHKGRSLDTKSNS